MGESVIDASPERDSGVMPWLAKYASIAVTMASRKVAAPVACMSSATSESRKSNVTFMVPSFSKAGSAEHRPSSAQEYSDGASPVNGSVRATDGVLTVRTFSIFW